MPNELTITIAGEAGQGVQTIGAALSRLFTRSGLSIISFQDYMSRVRGGNNFFQIRVATHDVGALRSVSDIVVALDKASPAIHRTSLASDGILIADTKKFGMPATPGIVSVPFYDLALTAGGNERYVNAVAYGIIAGLLQIPHEDVETTITAIFSDKDTETIEKNRASARAGYESVRATCIGDRCSLAFGPDKHRLLIDGNQAIALGAIRGGCTFYTAYPMTPSTTIMDTLAHYAHRFGIVVEQAEDEIAAINMAIGASAAGVRAMTGTSGGGFALMVEGLSLAAMTETPLVVALAQRPGPATGFPTRTEQADLNFILHAGHGEFARVIYTPGTIEEAFYLTVRAFNIAEEYQIPVVIMTDQYLADIVRDVAPFDLSKAAATRSIISKDASRTVRDYQRYQLTPSGISPRAIPSWISDVIYVDSDEHTEAGHITEDAALRRQMVEKRFYRKMEGLRQVIIAPTLHHPAGADVVLVGFGSTHGVLREVSAADARRKTGYMHLSQVWPFPAEEVTRLAASGAKLVTVENNAGAQLAQLIRRETGVTVADSILKFDGRPFTVDGVRAEIEQRISRWR